MDEKHLAALGYEHTVRLGKGAHGVVFSARHQSDLSVTVALKLIYEPFHGSDALITYNELECLRAFRAHPNIVTLLDVHVPERACLVQVLEYMETDLHAVIRANITKAVHRQYIFYQLLCAINYIHSAGVAHCDLKPANVLINTQCSVRLCDFGQVGNPQPTTAKWYRAPEALLEPSLNRNSCGDIWSCGSILMEMITGKPFFTGTSHINQLERIVGYLASPNEDVLRSYGPYAYTLYKCVEEFAGGNIHELEDRCGAECGTKLIQRMICWPEERFTATQLLECEYVSEFHDKESPQETMPAPLMDLSQCSENWEESVHKNAEKGFYCLLGNWSTELHPKFPSAIRSQIFAWLLTARKLCIFKDAALVICEYIATR